MWKHSQNGKAWSFVQKFLTSNILPPYLIYKLLAHQQISDMYGEKNSDKIRQIFYKKEIIVCCTFVEMPSAWQCSWSVE
jgi:hypothetical protein